MVKGGIVFVIHFNYALIPRGLYLGKNYPCSIGRSMYSRVVKESGKVFIEWGPKYLRYASERTSEIKSSSIVLYCSGNRMACFMSGSVEMQTLIHSCIRKRK